MSDKDPFGFKGAVDTAADPAEQPSVDLAAFEPKAKPVDRGAAVVASEVARSEGFSRRTAPSKPARTPAAPDARPTPVKGARRRIPLSQAVGFEDRYPDTERAQLNVLAPLPVVLRWRDLLKGHDGPAWALLEKAMDALEAGAGASRQARS